MHTWLCIFHLKANKGHNNYDMQNVSQLTKGTDKN